MNTSVEVKAEQGLVVIEMLEGHGGNKYQVHAEGCLDIARFIARGFEICYKGNSYVEFAMEAFSDLAGDYLTDADNIKVWNKAVINEADSYSPIKACCKKQIAAEVAPLKNVEVNI